MTLNRHIEICINLQRQGFGDLPLLYSSDSEGNCLRPVDFEPSLSKVEIPFNYETELDLEYDENDGVKPFTPNCIIIN